MIVLASTHARVVAERDDARERAEQFAYELQQANADNRYLRDRLAKVSGRLDTTEQLLTAAEDARATLEAQLAPFTARPRGQGGRFVRRAA